MFNLTDDRIQLNVHISAIAAGISIGFVIVVLLVSLWVWSVPQARGYLQRLSFRLLLYSMVWETVYNIAYIGVVLAGGDNAGCSAGVYFIIATLGTVNFIWTCIAINLALTVVFQINPILLKLERWYLGVSTALGFFIPIIPAGLGHFGWDPIINVCWITAKDEEQRLINMVMDVYLWQLLSCVIASLCVGATLVKLFLQGRATSRAMFGGDSINHLSLSDPHSEEEAKMSRMPWSLTRMLSRRRRTGHERAFGHLEDRFIRIALRVSLYPLAMIVVNTLIAAGDLYITVNGVHTTAGYALYCVYYWFYGGRGMIFCCLALFVDPCLSKGMYAAWRAKFPSKHASVSPDGKEAWGSDLAQPQPTLDTFAPRAPPLVATVMSSYEAAEGVAAPQNSLQRADSDGSMDMLQALFASEPPHVLEEQRRVEAKAVKDAARAARRSSRQSRGSIISFLRRASTGGGPVTPPATPQAPASSQLPPSSPPAEMEFAGVAALPAEFASLPDVVAPETLAAAAEERAKELDRISEHSGASTPRVATLAYMARSRGRRSSKAAGAGSGGWGSLDEEGSGTRSPNMGRGSPAGGVPSHGSEQWTPGYGGSLQSRSRTSAEGPMGRNRSPAEGRSRRQRALEIAEKLYEEMEAQL